MSRPTYFHYAELHVLLYSILRDGPGTSHRRGAQHLATQDKAPASSYPGGRKVLTSAVRRKLAHVVDRFDVYTKAAEQVTMSQAMLMNKVYAAVEIDRILIDCITHVGFGFAIY